VGSKQHRREHQEIRGTVSEAVLNRCKALDFTVSRLT